MGADGASRPASAPPTAPPSARTIRPPRRIWDGGRMRAMGRGPDVPAGGPSAEQGAWPGDAAPVPRASPRGGAPSTGLRPRGCGGRPRGEGAGRCDAGQTRGTGRPQTERTRGARIPSARGREGKTRSPCAAAEGTRALRPGGRGHRSTQRPRPACRALLCGPSARWPRPAEG